MIDELVREALESQVGPPPGSEVWPRIDRAGEVVRQHRRRRSAALAIAAVLLVTVVAGAVVARDHGHEVQVTTEPSTTAGATSAGPDPAANVGTLPAAGNGTPGVGFTPTTRSFVAARTSERGLIVYAAPGGMCDAPQAFDLSVSASTVAVSLVGAEPTGCQGGFELAGQYLVALPGPLGNRQVVDSTTGRHVPLLPAAQLLVPHDLPAGWSAQTEGISTKQTWTRCYGRGGCAYARSVVTSAQGTNIDDVLSAGLDELDGVRLLQQTYLGHSALVQLPFGYGQANEHHGQSIPADHKLAVDIDGHDGVLLLSYASDLVVWRDGPTWYSVSNPGYPSTTGDTAGRISTDELLRIARSMAPAS
jgi:hypothetical protein